MSDNLQNILAGMMAPSLGNTTAANDLSVESTGAISEQNINVLIQGRSKPITSITLGDMVRERKTFRNLLVTVYNGMETNRINAATVTGTRNGNNINQTYTLNQAIPAGIMELSGEVNISYAIESGTNGLKLAVKYGIVEILNRFSK